MQSQVSLVISVRRQAAELIVPAKPTPCEVKQLSDIDDQQGLRIQFPALMFCQNDPSVKGRDPVKVIREAISKALVFYYPVAGRLREGANRKLMVDCNGQGVMFIEADANVSLEQLGDSIQPPCPYIDELLYRVPGSEGIIGCPLLLIQVTRLICGGFVFAYRVNHTMFDAAGICQFLSAIAELSRGGHAPSLQPVWRREIFNARDPLRVTCIHHEYEEIVNSKDPLETTLLNNTSDHQSFFFGPKEMTALRNQLPPHLKNCSSFELLTACLWKCRTAALELSPHDIVRVSPIFTVRGKPHILHLPPGYYGNTFVFRAAISNVELLCKNPLGYAVDLVKKVKTETTEEYIRSVADLMVIKGRPMYSKTGNFIVSDLTRAGFMEIDFGWGKPVFSGLAGAISICSFFMKYRNRKGEDGIVVPIRLPQPVMERFGQELKRMTQQLVEDSFKMKHIRITSAF